MANLMVVSLRFRHVAIAVAALGIVFAAPVVAAPLTSKFAAPPCSATEYRQFDFWIGDWDTFEANSPGSPSMARARVKTIAQGCAIHELYEQSDGLVGDSILGYDAVRKEWQQTWVTNRGSIMVLWGNFDEGALVLEGEVHLRDGTSLAQRITWKIENDGVRESALLSKDNGKTWAPAFDVVFRKRADKRG